MGGDVLVERVVERAAGIADAEGPHWRRTSWSVTPEGYGALIVLGVITGLLHPPPLARVAVTRRAGRPRRLFTEVELVTAVLRSRRDVPGPFVVPAAAGPAHRSSHIK